MMGSNEAEAWYPEEVKELSWPQLALFWGAVALITLFLKN